VHGLLGADDALGRTHRLFGNARGSLPYPSKRLLKTLQSGRAAPPISSRPPMSRMYFASALIFSSSAQVMAPTSTIDKVWRSRRWFERTELSARTVSK